MTPPSPTTDQSGALADAQLDVAVVIKVTEETVCGINGGCNFDWKTTATPTITGATWAGDTLALTGTNLGTVASDLTVTLKDLAQQVDSADTTTASVTLTQIATKGDLTLGVKVASLGNALIATAVATQSATQFADSYSAVAPATGSAAGQLLTITGDHFAADITGSLKDTNNVEICSALTYVSKTELTCIGSSTAAAAYTNTKLVIGSTKVDCGTTCPYETTDALTPTATGVTQTNANTYVVEGTNFPTGSTLQTATLGGITANSGVIDSATQVTLTFANGIGFGNDLPLSALVFADGKHTKIDAAAKITVAFTATLAQNVACSYAGGCLYSVTGNNVNSLASSLSATVCDLPCVYDQAASTDPNTYKCRAPLLGTEYSAKTYTGLVAE